MASEVRMIKKYPNRRLYDTANSGYITLADVKQMVLGGIEFKVVDAKTNDDLTRAILLQIILDEEAGGMPMFSSEMLAQLIRFYGTAQQTIMGQYIEQNVQHVAEAWSKRPSTWASDAAARSQSTPPSTRPAWMTWSRSLVRLLNPSGADALALAAWYEPLLSKGRDRRATLGYYCAGMNKPATIARPRQRRRRASPRT